MHRFLLVRIVVLLTCNTERFAFSIIAVHGLNGHAFGTSAFQHDGRGVNEVMWLRDFLPHQLTSARIIIYGYNSALIGQNTSVSSLKDFAADLLQRILDDRQAATVRVHLKHSGPSTEESRRLLAP